MHMICYIRTGNLLKYIFGDRRYWKGGDVRALLIIMC